MLPTTIVGAPMGKAHSKWELDKTLDAERRMKRQTGKHVIEIKTVGELIEALQYVATHGDKLNGTWEVEWIADKVRLQMSYYDTEAYEWSYT